MRPGVWRRVLAALLLTACREPATEVTELGEPEAVLGRSFQQVSNVVEVGPNKIALAELRDRTFLFADFATGETTPIGAHADTIPPGDPAPGRHKYPGYVIYITPDSVGLVDFAAERTTLWNRKGEYLGVLPGRGVGGSNQPLYYDARLNGYKEDVRGVLGGLEPGDEVNFDSLNVLRIPPNDTIADTVARLKLPVWGRGQFGEQMKIVSTIFSGRDLFGVLPDGSIWAARASDNSVHWRSPTGQWSKGPSRSYTTVPVSEEEKAAFLDRLRQQMAQMGAPAGIELSYPFADEKPPFSAGHTNPLAGEVWLQRSRPYGDSVPVYDVVGRDGRQLLALQFPKGATLAGFGEGGRIYLVLREGDTQRIARYKVR
jgi:hypothetical protein